MALLTSSRQSHGPYIWAVGTITVDSPIVTNWHTSRADAVPFG
ncbi:hypothetical protein [Streptomyces sp. NPDC001880]